MAGRNVTRLAIGCNLGLSVKDQKRDFVRFSARRVACGNLRLVCEISRSRIVLVSDRAFERSDAALQLRSANNETWRIKR